MTEIIKKVTNSSIIRLIERKTPCIISIESKNDPINIKIQNSLEKMCQLFPMVLCYKISIRDYKEFHRDKYTYTQYHIIRFRDSKIEAVVDGTSQEEVYKLFWQVYSDSCANHFPNYMKILVSEERIPKLYEQIHVEKDDIDFLGKFEDGEIARCVERIDRAYPMPNIARRKKGKELIRKTKWEIKSVKSNIKSNYNHPVQLTPISFLNKLKTKIFKKNSLKVINKGIINTKSIPVDLSNKILKEN